jgi:2-polyprenyl-6-methoxyphenol hydroxylase-like FAD-dependent oxidoreductase
MSFTGRILVVGGGIGGLAVARGLAAQGAEVVIVERTKGFDAERIVWGRGRVWLLGDAAHAPLPNLGQGAAMALEDALALSRALETGNDVATAFERYVQVRHRRTSAIWRDSRRLGWIAQWSGPVATRIRNALFAWTPSSVGRRQLEAIVRPGVELARAQGDAVGSL